MSRLLHVDGKGLGPLWLCCLFKRRFYWNVFFLWKKIYFPDIIMSQLATFFLQNTVWCCYNVMNFLQNIRERHPIARPSGRGLLWGQPLIDIPPQFLQRHVQYHVILDHDITALDCIFINCHTCFLASTSNKSCQSLIFLWWNLYQAYVIYIITQMRIH